jgi:hypothetical protein
MFIRSLFVSHTDRLGLLLNAHHAAALDSNPLHSLFLLFVVMSDNRSHRERRTRYEFRDKTPFCYVRTKLDGSGFELVRRNRTIVPTGPFIPYSEYTTTEDEATDDEIEGKDTTDTHTQQRPRKKQRLARYPSHSDTDPISSSGSNLSDYTSSSSSPPPSNPTNTQPALTPAASSIDYYCSQAGVVHCALHL